MELVDTRDLKSLEGNFVPVQVRLRAPLKMLERYLKDIWKLRLRIILITFAFGVLSVFIALNVPNKYKSSVLLSVVDQNSSEISSISSLASQYGGIASLAGINLPSAGNSDRSAFAISTIKSRSFLKLLVEKDQQILPKLLASKSYDASRGVINFDSRLYDSENSKWIRKPTNQYGVIPTYLELHERFDKEFLSVSQDKVTGYINLSVIHISPIFAKDLLDLIVETLNESSRLNDLEESQKALDYLYKIRLQSTQDSVKDSINKLIEAQLKTQMMANIQDEYLVSILDESFVPEKKYLPSRALICILITFLGFFLCIVFSLSSTLYRDVKSNLN